HRVARSSGDAEEQRGDHRRRAALPPLRSVYAAQLGKPPPDAPVEPEGGTKRGPIHFATLIEQPAPPQGTKSPFVAWRGTRAYTPHHGRCSDALSHLLSLRGDLGARDHDAGLGDSRDSRRRAGSAEPWLSLPQGTRPQAPARESGSAAAADA